MPNETKHTAGALRAAQGIDNICGGVAGLPTDFLSRRTRENAIAELISRETHDAELLEALQEIVDAADQSNGGKGAELPWSLHVREIAATALRKAKEGR